MRKLAAVVALLLFTSSCGDHTTGPLPAPPSGDISDATRTTVEDRNSGFWWLPPMVASPDVDGTFQSQLSPVVRIVCHETSDGTCASEPIATFTRENGLLEVAADHFKANFDTHAYDLKTSSTDAAFTTYRIEVYTESIDLFGGELLMGYADFQLADNGREARGLATGEMIALVDNRTLPIRFFLNERAYADEIKQASADGALPEELQDLCLDDCSVTFIPADATEPVKASLVDDDSGYELAAMLFSPGDVAENSLLILDQRIPTQSDGESGKCTDGTVTLPTGACVRALIEPANQILGDHNGNGEPDAGEGVPIGVCPDVDQPADFDPETWRPVKFDHDGDPQVTRPPLVSVPFMTGCPTQNPDAGGEAFLGNPVRWFAQNLLDFFAPAVYATDQTRMGLQVQDLSDIFYVRDATLFIPDGQQPEAQAEAGSTVDISAAAKATHPEDHGHDAILLGNEPITIEVIGEQRPGRLLMPDQPPLHFEDDEFGILKMTVETGGAGAGLAEGRILVPFEVGQGENRIRISSPDLFPTGGIELTIQGSGGDGAEPDLLTFETLPNGDAVDGTTPLAATNQYTFLGAAFEYGPAEEGAPATPVICPSPAGGHAVAVADDCSSYRDGQLRIFVSSATDALQMHVIVGPNEPQPALSYLSGTETMNATSTVEDFGGFRRYRLSVAVPSGALGVAIALDGAPLLVDNLGVAPLGEPVLYGVNAVDEGLSTIDLQTGEVTFLGRLGGSDDALFTGPAAMHAAQLGDLLYAFSNDTQERSFLWANRCTGAALGDIVLSPAPPADIQAMGTDRLRRGILFAAANGVLYHTLSGPLEPRGTMLTDAEEPYIVTGMDAAPDGTLYAVDAEGRFLLIDPANADVTEIAPLMLDAQTPLENPAALVIDPIGRVIVSDLTTAALYTVDPVTAQATLLVELEEGAHAPEGMGFMPEPFCEEILF